jgi:hypothetical protein
MKLTPEDLANIKICASWIAGASQRYEREIKELKTTINWLKLEIKRIDNNKYDCE